MAKYMKRHFTKEVIQIEIISISISPATREEQVKTMMRYHSIPVRVAHIKK